MIGKSARSDRVQKLVLSVYQRVTFVLVGEGVAKALPMCQKYEATSSEGSQPRFCSIGTAFSKRVVGRLGQCNLDALAYNVGPPFTIAKLVPITTIPLV